MDKIIVNDNKRDVSFDFMKGLAMILVLVGHIMQRYICNYNQLPLFNLIWALQIPIFMFVSGFFCSKPISNKPFVDVGKLFISYMLPFFSFLYLVKVLCLHNFDGSFFDATVYTLNNLETSLWFLFVLFFLQGIGKCSVKVFKKSQKKVRSLVLFCIYWGLGLLPFAIIGVVFGMTFIGAKFVLYYSLFFAFGQIMRRFFAEATRIYNKYAVAIQIMLLVGFCIPIVTTNMFLSPDNMLGVAIRLLTGVTGCLLVLILCKIWNDKNRLKIIIANHIGRYTLEIYAAHMLFYVQLPAQQWGTFDAVFTVLIAGGYMFLLTALYIIVFRNISVTDLVLFGHYKAVVKRL